MGSDLKKRDLFDDPILTYWLRKRKNYKKIPPNISHFLMSYIRWDFHDPVCSDSMLFKQPALLLRLRGNPLHGVVEVL